MPMSTVITKESGLEVAEERAASRRPPAARRRPSRRLSRRPPRPPAIAGSARAGAGSRPRSTPSCAARAGGVTPTPAGRHDEAAASGDELADAIESDAALAIAVMRAANNGGGPHGRTGGVRQAVDVLTVDRVRRIAAAIDTYDPFERPGVGRSGTSASAVTRVATRHAADRIAELARLPERDELAVAALLHDVGRLVLAEMYGEFSAGRPRTRRPTSGSAASVASSASTTRWSARSWSAAGACRRASPRRSSATTRRRPPATRRRSGWRTWSSTTRAATRSPPASMRRGRRRSSGSSATRSAPLLLRVPALERAAPAHHGALPALGSRDRRPARARRGQGLQADRRRSCRSR